MWIIYAIGDVFYEMAALSAKAYDYCDSIPLLGGSLKGFFEWMLVDFAQVAFWFYDLSDWADGVVAKLGDMLTWENVSGWLSDLWNRVTDKVAELWTWITSQVAELWSYIRDHFAEIWSWVTDHVAELGRTITEMSNFLFRWIDFKVGEVWRWLSVLPSRVGVIIYQWLADHLFQWFKDRAAQAVDVAGSILEAVW